MKVLIVHGYQAAPEKHWFPWIAEKIQQMGAVCEIVHLEEPEHPEYPVWKECLEIQLAPLNDDSIIIAHSLGCISTLDYLSQALQGRSLKAIFLIAGFYEKLAALPELDAFIDHTYIQDTVIRSRIRQRWLFLSSNDPVVPAPLSIRLGHLINAQMVEIRDAGHFTQDDGWLEFPQLWEQLQPLLSDGPSA
ncbi:RBBP9/YdeN family alpha/beta hydrolase [Acinetobacter sp. WZC-1]|uniref:RBBP9/YdeN family alpha/beta hydrolase n=1 Tax=Acinetobacter sp. WZC-1 TaxID=3459034 RepID=UPI00403D8AF9